MSTPSRRTLPWMHGFERMERACKSHTRENHSSVKLNPIPPNMISYKMLTIHPHRKLHVSVYAPSCIPLRCPYATPFLRSPDDLADDLRNLMRCMYMPFLAKKALVHRSWGEPARRSMSTLCTNPPFIHLSKRACAAAGIASTPSCTQTVLDIVVSMRGCPGLHLCSQMLTLAVL